MIYLQDQSSCKNWWRRGKICGSWSRRLCWKLAPVWMMATIFHDTLTAIDNTITGEPKSGLDSHA